MNSNSLKMDIENPLNLKRSSSAPMINELNNILVNQTNTIRENSPKIMAGGCRPRRFSTSFSPLSGPSSPKLTPRVNQLRQEESVDILGREAAHERELNSAMVMSQSYEDLTLLTEPKMEEVTESPVNSPAPSPTRLPLYRHYFLKTSPSPTRKFTTRRSQSPIAMRPSSLGPVKRKCDLELSEPPQKKISLLISQPKHEVRSSESDSTSSFDSIPSPLCD